jgi:hypothetical protein
MVGPYNLSPGNAGHFIHYSLAFRERVQGEGYFPNPFACVWQTEQSFRL